MNLFGRIKKWWKNLDTEDRWGIIEAAGITLALSLLWTVLPSPKTSADAKLYEWIERIIFLNIICSVVLAFISIIKIGMAPKPFKNNPALQAEFKFLQEFEKYVDKLSEVARDQPLFQDLLASIRRYRDYELREQLRLRAAYAESLRNMNEAIFSLESEGESNEDETQERLEIQRRIERIDADMKKIKVFVIRQTVEAARVKAGFSEGKSVTEEALREMGEMACAAKESLREVEDGSTDSLTRTIDSLPEKRRLRLVQGTS